MTRSDRISRSGEWLNRVILGSSSKNGCDDRVTRIRGLLLESLIYHLVPYFFGDFEGRDDYESLLGAALRFGGEYRGIPTPASSPTERSEGGQLPTG